MKIKYVLLTVSLLYQVEATMAQQFEDTTREKYTLLFRGTPIEEALRELVGLTKIDLIYDPAILQAQRVFSLSNNEYPETILSNILKGTNLDFIRLSSGTYVIITTAENEPRYGSLAGMVLDKNTGKPLEGANILIADASTGTSSNHAGRFTIAPLLTGNYELIITYVGYKPVRDTVSIPGNMGNPRQFYLESRPVFVEPLVISGIQRRLPYYNGESVEISNLTESVSSFTGSPDAIKSINSIMGINFSIPLADFNVQGGAEGEHQVLLDGTPVYNPVSLGRLTGAFSPYALNKITVHKAGYRASIGSQLSGIISIDQDIPGESENNIIMQADPLSVNGRLNLVTTFDNGIEFKSMVAGRSNIWRWYENPKLSNTLKNWDRIDPVIANTLINNGTEQIFFNPSLHDSDINFYDLHWSGELSYNEFHDTYASFYRGKNYLQTRLLSNKAESTAPGPESMYTQDTYDWLNNALRLEHNWLMSSRLQSQFAISYSSHHSNHHFGMAGTDDISQVPNDSNRLVERLSQYIGQQPHTGDENFVTETTFHANFEYSLNQRHKIGVGLEPKIVDYAFKLSDLFYHFSSSKSSTFMLSGFLEDEFSISYQTKLVGGSRFTYVPKHDKLFAEPRLSLQTDFPETSAGFLSLKLAGGLYRQYINQFDITNVGPSSVVPSIRFWVPVDFTTEVPKSYHLSTEILLEPIETLSLRWESFYKWNPSILAVDYHALLEEPDVPGTQFNNQNSFVEQGKSYSLGAGFSAEKFIEPLMMEMSLSYQYSLAKRKVPKRFDHRFVDTPWNEPHKISAAVNWNILPSLLATIRWQSIWGKSWAFNRAYYDYLTIDPFQAQYGSISFDSPSNDRLSPYHQLDIGFSYTQKLNSTKLQLRVDLINVLDRKNLLEKRLVPKQSADGSIQYSTQNKVLPGFSPSLGLRFTF